MDRKREIEAIFNDLQERSVTHEVLQIKKLLGLLVEDAKDRLMRCNAEEFVGLQGEAKAYDRTLGRLTRPSLSSRGERYD